MNLAPPWPPESTVILRMGPSSPMPYHGRAAGLVPELGLDLSVRQACNSNRVVYPDATLGTSKWGRSGHQVQHVRVERSDDVRELFLLEDADDGGWQERALCAQTDPEAFFPEKGGSTREAKKVCLTCEVRDDCLEAALMNDERFGIWGGLSERERRKLKKRAV